LSTPRLPSPSRQHFCVYAGHVAGVYRIKGGRQQARRGLVLDFQNRTCYTINSGKRSNTYQFSQILKVESEDGEQFTLTFVSNDGSTKAPVTYEADSLEEKNQCFRLLSLVVNANRSNLKGSQGVTIDTVEDHESLPVMKEARVEKKGTQGLAMFNWQSRWLKVRANELA
jgi:hypothetical protein